MTASTLTYKSTSGNWALGTGMSASNAYAFNPYQFTGGTFTPHCVGTNVVTTGVNSAATASDWLLLNATVNSNALVAAYAAMPTTSTTLMQNKGFVAELSNVGRAALQPLVKAEYFAGTLAPGFVSLISSLVTSCIASLTTYQLSVVDATSKTALIGAYTAEKGVIDSSLTRLKTLENKIYNGGDSIDVLSASLATSYASVTNLANFVGAKTYLSSLFDPAFIANSGTAIPNTFTNSTTAASLATIFTNAATSLTGSTTIKQLVATTEMSANAIFDLYCAQIQGYTSTGTSGVWTSGSAPVGVVPGIDYSIYMTGLSQSVQLASDGSVTIAAAAGTVGAPSVASYYLA